MVHFPPNVTLDGPDGAGRSCSNGGFCAYHYTGGTISDPLVYGAIMDTFSGGCSQGCSANTTALEDQTDVASHELAESVTDTEIGLLPESATQIEYPVGWYDGNCGEVADICDDYVPGATITVSGRNWAVQELWSNQQAQCTSSTALHPTFQLGLPTTATAGAPFNFTLTAENPAGNGGTDNAYVGTVQFTSSDSNATLPSPFTFSGANLGTKSFTATLQTLGSQTIVVTSTAGTASGTSGSVTVQAASPGIYSPVSGSTLVGDSATFRWGPYPSATAYWLDVGSTQGGNNYYQSGSLSASTLSQTVNSLPENGSMVWVTWWYLVGGTWQYTEYSYTAVWRNRGGDRDADESGSERNYSEWNQCDFHLAGGHRQCFELLDRCRQHSWREQLLPIGIASDDNYLGHGKQSA
jgi:hypothetical protein